MKTSSKRMGRPVQVCALPEGVKGGEDSLTGEKRFVEARTVCTRMCWNKGSLSDVSEI